MPSQGGGRGENGEKPGKRGGRDKEAPREGSGRHQHACSKGACQKKEKNRAGEKEGHPGTSTAVSIASIAIDQGTKRPL